MKGTMISVNIPGFGDLQLRTLVSDYNGTLACDGMLIGELMPSIETLATQVDIHVVTADTFGLARSQLSGLPVQLTILPPESQDKGKLKYVRQLDPHHTVCLGNGRNDMLMLKESVLGICLTEAEGTCVQTLQSADVLCRSAKDAFELLLNPKRLIATLRK